MRSLSPWGERGEKEIIKKRNVQSFKRILSYFNTLCAIMITCFECAIISSCWAWYERLGRKIASMQSEHTAFSVSDGLLQILHKTVIWYLFILCSPPWFLFFKTKEIFSEGGDVANRSINFSHSGSTRIEIFRISDLRVHDRAPLAPQTGKRKQTSRWHHWVRFYASTHSKPWTLFRQMKVVTQS